MRFSFFSGLTRSFFFAFFGSLGVLFAFIFLFVGIGVFYSLGDSDHYGKKVKLLPDANGNRKQLSMDVPVILQVPIKGVIGADSLTGDKIEEILLSSREKEFKHERVKGILLMINSPGGGVIASDQIYHHLLSYKKRFGVPIYAYIDGICASGGYYISCAADQLYASNVSVVGSVGVISYPPFLNISDALKKIGVESQTLYAGKGKDSMNAFRPWEEGESGHYQKLINYYYEDFVKIVCASRPQISEENLVEIYGAEVLPAPVAAKDGFIDEAGVSREVALSELVKAAGITGEYQVVCFEKKNVWKELFSKKSPFVTGEFNHTLKLSNSDQIHEELPFSYTYFTSRIGISTAPRSRA
ncbi:MAG: S49 family peptidase [Chlamydiia bacterium]|nr:S49 family peptidase [Chlamydiia bacterium]